MRMQGDLTQLRKDTSSRLKAEYEQKLREAMAAIDLLEGLGVCTSGATTDDSQSERQPFKAKTNPGDPSWAEAIDMVLCLSKKPMTVKEIANELLRRGRKFPNERPTVSIAPVMQRRKKGMNWERVGKGSPARWRKLKERKVK